MNILILSSSLSPSSRSYLLCKEVEKYLPKETSVEFIDARNFELLPVHRGPTKDMETIATSVKNADAIIIGMGIHCYSLNDALKIIFDSCFADAKGKLFGLLCAAGGERSYLATQHVVQICMNEWRMIPLPRTVYASGKDFDEESIINEDITTRCKQFAEEFVRIGNKLV